MVAPVWTCTYPALSCANIPTSTWSIYLPGPSGITKDPEVAPLLNRETSRAEIRKQQERHKQPKRENWGQPRKTRKTRKPRKPQKARKPWKRESPREARKPENGETEETSSQLFAAFSSSFCFFLFLNFLVFSVSWFFRFLGFLRFSHVYASHRSGHNAQTSCLDCVNLH